MKTIRLIAKIVSATMGALILAVFITNFIGDSLIEFIAPSYFSSGHSLVDLANASPTTENTLNLLALTVFLFFEIIFIKKSVLKTKDKRV